MTTTADIDKLVSTLTKERDELRRYIMAKWESDNDYHAIADACMDIREIDAVLNFLKSNDI